ncbi:rhomboid family intramembrane serine protease [Streptomyces thermolilacinus]|uniref:Rhomboid family intramembrane serine protease n=1 Tax=Streptomyces thermolilacinus SPC6 TaxID=1306406 RepID=A0A1D3DSV3_9ACTN|nr:rhomboid family intramembrane serine protease [Streptomyces thermolilacinus]OEJ95401.1 rhomboid family intramembrane serine protease [Streptomyces thermolilacinus SPC6]
MEQSQAPNGLSSCYRHPGVETGVRCTRCERPICPDCMVAASVGFQCPECVRGGSGTGHAPGVERPRNIAGGAIASGDQQLVTKVLIGLNLLVFLAGMFSTGLVDELVLIGLAFDPELARVVGVADGEWYRLLTAAFLHREVWHIAFNMFGLWVLGGPLEAALGRVRYLALYVLSGLAGSALTYVIAAPNQGSLGASGAVFGLMGATLVLYRRLRYDLRPVLGLIALNVLITVVFRDVIAWEAHLGGLVAGAIVAYGMVGGPRAMRPLFQWGACALVLIATVGMTVMRTAALS